MPLLDNESEEEEEEVPGPHVESMALTGVRVVPQPRPAVSLAGAAARAEQRRNVRDAMARVAAELGVPLPAPVPAALARVTAIGRTAGHVRAPAGAPAARAEQPRQPAVAQASSGGVGKNAPRAEALTVGRTCRVWLPAAVLAAGASLRKALEGEKGLNIAHLRKRYPGVTVAVAGKTSSSVPADQRLHVVASCKDQAILDKVAADLSDLAEAAVDMVADELGMDEDSVQDAFEGIRVEKFAIRVELEEEEATPASNVVERRRRVEAKVGVASASSNPLPTTQQTRASPTQVGRPAQGIAAAAAISAMASERFDTEAEAKPSPAERLATATAKAAVARPELNANDQQDLGPHDILSIAKAMAAPPPPAVVGGATPASEASAGQPDGRSPALGPSGALAASPEPAATPAALAPASDADATQVMEWDPATGKLVPSSIDMTFLEAGEGAPEESLVNPGSADFALGCALGGGWSPGLASGPCLMSTAFQPQALQLPVMQQGLQVQGHPQPQMSGQPHSSPAFMHALQGVPLEARQHMQQPPMANWSGMQIGGAASQWQPLPTQQPMAQQQYSAPLQQQQQQFSSQQLQQMRQVQAAQQMHLQRTQQQQEMQRMQDMQQMQQLQHVQQHGMQRLNIIPSVPAIPFAASRCPRCNRVRLLDESQLGGPPPPCPCELLQRPQFPLQQPVSQVPALATATVPSAPVIPTFAFMGVAAAGPERQVADRQGSPIGKSLAISEAERQREESKRRAAEIAKTIEKSLALNNAQAQAAAEAQAAAAEAAKKSAATERPNPKSSDVGCKDAAAERPEAKDATREAAGDKKPIIEEAQRAAARSSDGGADRPRDQDRDRDRDDRQRSRDQDQAHHHSSPRNDAARRGERASQATAKAADLEDAASRKATAKEEVERRQRVAKEKMQQKYQVATPRRQDAARENVTHTPADSADVATKSQASVAEQATGPRSQSSSSAKLPPPPELLAVRSAKDWHGWKSAWPIPAAPNSWSKLLFCGHDKKPCVLRVFKGEEEVWGFTMLTPCTVLGSNVKSAHLADLTHDSVKVQHAALLWLRSGHFAVEPINGRVQAFPASSHPGVVAALARQGRAPPSEEDAAVDLPVGSGRQTLGPRRCCLRLAQSRLTFFLDMLPAAEERRPVPRTPSQSRSRSPIGVAVREAPSDEEDQENAWRSDAAGTRPKPKTKHGSRDVRTGRDRSASRRELEAAGRSRSRQRPRSRSSSRKRSRSPKRSRSTKRSRSPKRKRSRSRRRSLSRSRRKT